MLTNSPHLGRKGGNGKSKLREVKSGIFLSESVVSAPQSKPWKVTDPAPPLIRTKSGSLRKITSKETITALTEEDEAEGSGTRVTSRFARVMLAGSGFLADAVRTTGYLLFFSDGTL